MQNIIIGREKTVWLNNKKKIKKINRWSLFKKNSRGMPPNAEGATRLYTMMCNIVYNMHKYLYNIVRIADVAQAFFKLKLGT